MLVRNVTGVEQHTVIGGETVVLPATDQWIPVPVSVAMELHRLRLVDIKFTKQDSLESFMWEDDDNGLHLYWSSPLSACDGYGVAAESLLWAAVSAGIHVYPSLCWFDSKKFIKSETDRLLEQKPPQPLRVGLCLAQPDHYYDMPTPYKIGYTMYESSDPLKERPEWYHACLHIDRLLVPSTYSADVFKAFVRVPVDVLPIPLRNEFYAPVQRVPRETFTFGCHGTLTARKNPLLLIEAFRKAFPANEYPDVSLELKTRKGYCGWGPRQLPAITDRRIRIYNEDWSTEKLLQWLYSLDAYVFPSSGEGYGLPPREAIATGLPTAVTAGSALRDLCVDGLALSLPVGPPEDSPLGGTWMVPTLDGIVSTMRMMYRSREKMYQFGFKSGRMFAENYSPTAIGEGFDVYLRQIDGIPKRPRRRRFRGSIREEFVSYIRKQIPPGSAVAVVKSKELADSLTALGYKTVVLTSFYSSIPIRVAAIVSECELQTLYWDEITRVLDRYLRQVPLFLAAVPTAYLQKTYSDDSRMFRPAVWNRWLYRYSPVISALKPDKTFVAIRIGR